MALIVQQHTVVDAFDVNPNVTAASARIYQGTIVGIDQSGWLSYPTTGTVYPLGIAGDNYADEYKTSAYSESVVVSASGATRRTSNRVSDFFNETLASGKMTVYIGSGVFATDQYLTHNTFTVGAPVYATTTGQLTANAGSGFLARPVGYVKKAASSYPSGVPSADSADATGTSLSLGTFLTIHLSI